MTFFLTLVDSKKSLNDDFLTAFIQKLKDDGLEVPSMPVWLSAKQAVDLELTVRPSSFYIKYLRNLLASEKIDIFIQAAQGRRKKLLLADMDSTIVTGETLDDMAALAGIGDQIAPITARAMRGEIDFKGALDERVGLLAGMPESLLAETLADTTLSDGAKTFVQTMAHNGAKCVLVSGGFTFFTSAIAKKTGFHAHHGNILDIKDGKLVGTVSLPILDKSAKLSFLKEYTEQKNIACGEAITIGDGANDLAMLEAAGLGIGYYAKPLLQDTLDNVILYSDLTAALFAQGYCKEEFVR